MEITKIKCFLMGDSETGKTSFLATLSSGHFPQAFISDVHENVSFDLNDNTCNIEFIESDSTEDRSDQFKRVLDLMQQHSQHEKNTRFCILLCFSHDNLSTFKSIEKRWLSELDYLNYTHSFERQISFLILGLKSDQAQISQQEQQQQQQQQQNTDLYSSTLKLNSNQEKSQKKKLNYKEISKKLGAYDYVEVSSMLNKIDRNSFFKLIQEAVEHEHVKLDLKNSRKYSKMESTTRGSDSVAKTKLNTFIMRLTRSLFACTSASHEKSKQFVNTRIRDSFRRNINRKSHVLLKANSMISLDDLC